MRKLLTSSLLLAGCTLQSASAQKVAVPYYQAATKPTVKADATSPADLEIIGWRFDNIPMVDAADNNPGFIRFRFKISNKGEVESVSKQAGNVSPAQERECRDKLLNAHFVKTGPDARATTGFYTFHFTVK